jgi:hypothetical protein
MSERFLRVTAGCLLSVSLSSHQSPRGSRQLTACSCSPHITFSQTRGWVCLLWIGLTSVKCAHRIYSVLLNICCFCAIYKSCSGPDFEWTHRSHCPVRMSAWTAHKTLSSDAVPIATVQTCLFVYSYICFILRSLPSNGSMCHTTGSSCCGW